MMNILTRILGNDWSRGTSMSCRELQQSAMGGMTYGKIVGKFRGVLTQTCRLIMHVAADFAYRQRIRLLNVK